MGVWRYCDADGRALHEVDLGAGPPGLEPDGKADDRTLTAAVGLAAEAAAAMLLDLCREQAARGHATSAFVLELRRVARLDDQVALEALASRLPAMTLAATEAVVRGGGEPAGQEEEARLLDGLMRGAHGGHVFAALARRFGDVPAVGLELATLALKLGPDVLEAATIQVVFLIRLGRFADAARALARLTEQSPEAARPLSSVLRVTLAPLSFSPGSRSFEDGVSSELPTEVSQPPEVLRAAIGKAARRLGLVREALVDTLGAHAPCLPPDVSTLVDRGTTLDSYVFETEDGDTVRVEEQPPLAGMFAGELLLQARREWTTLCWLCYGAGLDDVGLPEALAAPADFAQAITTAFARHFWTEDQIQTGGLRGRSQHRADFTWEGMPMEELPGPLLSLARDEFLEMRSALYFAADDSCRSVWQDDLRG